MNFNSKIHLKVMPRIVSAETSHDKHSSLYSLSPEQIEFYNQNGYLVIKQLIDINTLYNCRQRFKQISNGNVDKGCITIIKDLELLKAGKSGENVVNKLQDIAHDDIFSLYTEHPKLLHVISQFIGEDIHATHSMLINKPPGSAEHPPHQDLLYIPIRPADKIIASWTAIDEVTVENGGLFVLPGTHKNEMLHHDKFKNSKQLYYGLNLPSRDQAVSLEMSPGDTVFFHPLLIHGSGPNPTKGFRKAILCHYASSSCTYIASEKIQESLINEITTLMRKQGLTDITYTEYWKIKTKLVRGLRSNL